MTTSKEKNRRLISIITPVFNEEDNVEPFVDAVCQVMDGERDNYHYEIVFTDNHSTDSTFEKLEALAKNNGKIRVFRFSKNFGYQKSILTGYQRARGDAAIQLDCDLQDPPSLIPEFIRLWESGYKVVYGVRTKRREGILVTALRLLFYRVIDFLSDDPLPHDAGDFRLVDRVILDQLREMDDCDPYLRGTIAALGYKQVGVSYERHARERGYSKFNFYKLVQLAVDGISNHSVMPLRISFFVGMGVSLLTFFVSIGYLVGRFLFQQTWPPGFATIVILILFSIAVQAIFLGIIGEYVGRIYRQLKTPASVIVEVSVNEDK